MKRLLWIIVKINLIVSAIPTLGLLFTQGLSVLGAMVTYVLFNLVLLMVFLIIHAFFKLIDLLKKSSSKIDKHT